MDRKYLLGLYEKAMPSRLTWAEKLQAAKDAGFDYVEMSVDETDGKLARLDMTDGEVDAIRAAMRATGLGIRTIQLAGYDVYYEEGSEQTRADFLKNLRKAASMAAEEGVQLGFETMETPFMDTVAKAMHYVREVDSPYLGVYPDAGNITNAALLYHGDPIEDLETGRGHIVAVHLKETVPGKYREIPFGTGHVDFQSIVAKSWELGVRRYVAEFWYNPATDWREELSKANDFMRNYLDKE